MLIVDYIVSLALSENDGNHWHLDSFFDEMTKGIKQLIIVLNNSFSTSKKLKPIDELSDKKLVFSYLIDHKLLLASDITVACINITIDNFSDVVIHGNRNGLIVLADYITHIALSRRGKYYSFDNSNLFDEIGEGVNGLIVVCDKS